jgi:vacuolar iron transporter family protein
MSRHGAHAEWHKVSRLGWLRPAVLGANDGIVSTASLMLGVAAAAPDPGAVLVAGIAGLVAGAMSMAAGEYVSVKSQADTEAADLARERRELAEDPIGEHRELAGIYRSRGLDKALAEQVATQMMAGDALAAHARDELGMSDHTNAQPLLAAAASAVSFAAGAIAPLLIAVLTPTAWMTPAVAGGSLVFLAALGAVGARTGGAPVGPATLRVAFWGALAMAVTAGIGALVGVAV